MRRSLTKDAGDGPKVGERENFVPGASESICKPLHEKGSGPRRRSCKLLILRRESQTLPREGWHYDCLVNRVRVWDSQPAFPPEPGGLQPDLPIQPWLVFLCLQTADDSIHLCLTGSEPSRFKTSPYFLSRSSHADDRVVFRVAVSERMPERSP
jgi:hypothetical protein